MEGGPSPGRRRSPARRSLDAGSIARVAFGLLCLACAVGFLVYPTYPNYDSYYSLLWGRELLDLDAAVLRGLPRADRASAGDRESARSSSLFGDGADRLCVALIVASFVALVAGSTRSARPRSRRSSASSPPCCVLTRFDFPFLAARGYIDIPYLALVVWAAVLELRSAAPRRRRCSCCSRSPAMLRPEAWLLAGLYWLWVAWPATWRAAHQLRGAGGDRPAGLGGDRLPRHRRPDVLAVTRASSPTSSAAQGTGAVPAATWSSSSTRQVPGAARDVGGLAAGARARAAAAGHAARAVRIGRGDVRAGRLPAAVGHLPLPAVPSLAMVMVFAGVRVGGWTMLQTGRAARVRGRRRGAARRASGSPSRRRACTSPAGLRARFRGDAHAALVQVSIAQPGRRGCAAARCMSEPQARPGRALVPGPAAGTRSSRALDWTRAPDEGVVILVHGRQALFNQALVTTTRLAAPPVAAVRYYAAYVGDGRRLRRLARCEGASCWALASPRSCSRSGCGSGA